MNQGRGYPPIASAIMELHNLNGYEEARFSKIKSDLAKAGIKHTADLAIRAIVKAQIKREAV